jgi:hypothetical protein
VPLGDNNPIKLLGRIIVDQGMLSRCGHYKWKYLIDGLK